MSKWKEVKSVNKQNDSITQGGKPVIFLVDDIVPLRWMPALRRKTASSPDRRCSAGEPTSRMLPKMVENVNATPRIIIGKRYGAGGSCHLRILVWAVVQRRGGESRLVCRGSTWNPDGRDAVLPIQFQNNACMK